MIPYGKQTVNEEDIQAVVDVLKSDWLTQGPKISEFEEALADYCRVKYAVAVSNGTAALHLANLAIGTDKTSGVITTPNSFLATSNSVVYAGGRPYFADIRKDTFNIDPDQVRSVLQSTPGIKGIIPVHFAGVVADMETIDELAREYQLWVIEDACHALGGKWIDRNGNKHRVGDCAFSDMTIFSFHPVKQITTGEGGAIVTNNKEIYDKLLMLRTHGIVRDPEKMNSSHGAWYYEMQALGFNYRITDFQAALGIEQLKRNDFWVARRRELVNRYDEAFQDMKQVFPQLHPDRDGDYSYHLYVIQTERRKELYDYLKSHSIFTQVHYIPIHLQPYYRKKYGYNPGDFPLAEAYYEKTLSLPLYPSLLNSEQDRVIHLIKEFHAKS